MYASKVFVLAILLHGVGWAQTGTKPNPPAATQPQTIGELSDLARSKQLSPQTQKPNAPNGMVIEVPSTEILAAGVTQSGSASPAVKRIRKEPPPEVLPELAGIFRAGRQRNSQFTVELVDSGGVQAYSVGDLTPSGWMVKGISSHEVIISKMDVRSKKERILNLRIPR